MGSRGVQEITRDIVGAVAGTVESFAGEADVSAASIFAWQAGRRSPGIVSTVKVAAALRQRAAVLTELAAELEAVGDVC